jgi:hypothetical protein
LNFQYLSQDTHPKGKLAIFKNTTLSAAKEAVRVQLPGNGWKTSPETTLEIDSRKKRTRVTSIAHFHWHIKLTP